MSSGRTREYAVVVILNSEATETEIANTVGRVSRLITDGGGEVSRQGDLGIRKLSYPIHQFADMVDRAKCVGIRFSLDARASEELQRELRPDPSEPYVLRYGFHNLGKFETMQHESLLATQPYRDLLIEFLEQESVAIESSRNVQLPSKERNTVEEIVSQHPDGEELSESPIAETEPEEQDDTGRENGETSHSEPESTAPEDGEPQETDAGAKVEEDALKEVDDQDDNGNREVAQDETKEQEHVTDESDVIEPSPSEPVVTVGGIESLETGEDDEIEGIASGIVADDDANEELESSQDESQEPHPAHAENEVTVLSPTESTAVDGGSEKQEADEGGDGEPSPVEPTVMGDGETQEIGEGETEVSVSPESDTTAGRLSGLGHVRGGEVPFAQRFSERQTREPSPTREDSVFLPTGGQSTEESARRDTRRSRRHGRSGSRVNRMTRRWEATDASKELEREFKEMAQGDYGHRCQICGNTFRMRNGELIVSVVHVVPPAEDNRTNHYGNLLGLCGWHYQFVMHGEWSLMDPETQRPFERWEDMRESVLDASPETDDEGDTYISLPVQFFNVYWGWSGAPETRGEVIRYSIPHWKYLKELLST